MHYCFLTSIKPTTAKAQKATYSKIIYDEIRGMDPPGRFLKQDLTTKLWSDIGEKKALHKTRQALREGLPELLEEMGGGGGDETSEESDVQASKGGAENAKPKHVLLPPK